MLDTFLHNKVTFGVIFPEEEEGCHLENLRPLSTMTSHMWNSFSSGTI